MNKTRKAKEDEKNVERGNKPNSSQNEKATLKKTKQCSLLQFKYMRGELSFWSWVVRSLLASFG